MLPAIIGITGKMGSGKNAVGDILHEDFGYELIAFADPLRAEVAEAIRRQWMPDGISLHLWEIMLESTPEQVYAKPTVNGMRELLQWFGSDFRRVQDPNYWVKKTAKRMKPGQRYAITDVRFPNEADFIINGGGVVWRVKRNGVKPNGINGHQSEKHIDRLHAHLAIDNNGTLDDLRDKIHAVLGGTAIKMWSGILR